MIASADSAARQRVERIREAWPSEGLFKGKEWLLSPDSFPLSPEVVARLDRLGPALLAFQGACNRLYLESAHGARPAWIAELLDRGKPAHLVELGRQARFAGDLPRVLRPDVILTKEGFTIAEIDSLPGGIGVTAWMNEVYTGLGDGVIGGAEGMIRGFAQVLGHGDVLISRESQDYRPEMEWMTEQIRTRLGASESCRVVETARFVATGAPREHYRFFELWDLPNVEHAEEFTRGAAEGSMTFTPPLKPFLEEKLWLALFWTLPLRETWEELLGKETFEFLQACIPYGWVFDPAPLPPFAEIPRLHIQSWQELGEFSQKQRRLVLKVSGFSELGWGSRGVSIGHDMPSQDWRKAVALASEQFGHNPYLLQEFHSGELVYHPYAERGSGELKVMEGRVRLCPYYFVEQGTPRLSGVMATIVSAEKKLIHGMRDAIIVPCAAE